MGPELAPGHTAWPDRLLLISQRKQDNQNRSAGTGGLAPSLVTLGQLPAVGPHPRLTADIPASAHRTGREDLHTCPPSETGRPTSAGAVGTDGGGRDGGRGFGGNNGAHWDLGPQGAGPFVAFQRKKEISSVLTCADAFSESETSPDPHWPVEPILQKGRPRHTDTE